MKSLKSVLITLLYFTFITSYGQFFAGGNIQLSSSKAKVDNVLPSDFTSSGNSYSFNPCTGKFLSGKIAVGIMLNLQFEKNKIEDNYETINKSYTLGAAPFLRYYFWNWHKFSAFGEATMGMDFSKSSRRTNGTVDDNEKQTEAYFNISPGITFDISDKISLQTSLNFLDLSFYYTSIENDGSTQKSTGFSSGARLDNIISVGSLNIGAIYKF